ncbi:MAG: class I SAM-dependent methyltransferase [Patescibacteria group bacterium]|jgi:SAM-dependent methyltransferase
MKKGAKSTIKDYAEFWRKLPAEIKPTPFALAFWEAKIKILIKQNSQLRALVLGATPEIRDLLAKYNIKTVCLDINPLMTKAMGLLVRKKNPKEKIVIGSWLRMPFEKESFDLVIADCPQDNLPFAKWPAFFNNIYRVLKPDGYWFLGTIFFIGFQEGITLDQFIKIYRRNPKIFKNQSWKFYYALKLTCNPEFYNSKQKIGDWIKLDKKIFRLYEKKQITGQEFKNMNLFTNKLGQSLACRFTWITKNEFYNFLKKHHFSIFGHKQDKKLPADCFRWAFILKK